MIFSCFILEIGRCYVEIGRFSQLIQLLVQQFAILLLFVNRVAVSQKEIRNFYLPDIPKFIISSIINQFRLMYKFCKVKDIISCANYRAG